MLTKALQVKKNDHPRIIEACHFSHTHPSSDAYNHDDSRKWAFRRTKLPSFDYVDHPPTPTDLHHPPMPHHYSFAMR